MSQKRMFDRAIIDMDKFMDLPMSAKAIYFLLGMEADDEGFVSYKKILRIHGGNEDDIKVLLAKSFIISFPSGVVVITDWNKNNWLDKRRIRPTEYQNEKKLLALQEDNSYCLASAKPLLSQYSIEESSIEEKDTPYKFKKPTLEEVKAYSKERDNRIDNEKFINYYESNGWKVGRHSMKDWKASVRNWEKNDQKTIAKRQDDIKYGIKEVIKPKILTPQQEESKKIKIQEMKDKMLNKKFF